MILLLFNDITKNNDFNINFVDSFNQTPFNYSTSDSDCEIKLKELNANPFFTAKREFKGKKIPPNFNNYY